jgi:hypothetical protein
MEPLVAPLTFLTPNKTRSQRLVICQIRIHSTRGHFCVKMAKYMHMDMKMIMRISTTWLLKLGPKSEWHRVQIKLSEGRKVVQNIIKS